MARQVTRTAHGPAIIKIGDSEVSICRCGLSQDVNGLCDKSHLATLKEDERLIYIYNGKDEVIDAYPIPTDEEESDCCGGECGCEEKPEELKAV